MSLRLKDSPGPSIIVTASFVGVGELIVAPRRGATVGLSALWLILSGAVMQILLLPVSGLSILLIRRRRDDLFRPGAWFDWTLRLSVAIIALAAGYRAWRLVRGG